MAIQIDKRYVIAFGLLALAFPLLVVQSRRGVAGDKSFVVTNIGSEAVVDRNVRVKWRNEANEEKILEKNMHHLLHGETVAVDANAGLDAEGGETHESLDTGKAGNRRRHQATSAVEQSQKVEAQTNVNMAGSSEAGKDEQSQKDDQQTEKEEEYTKDGEGDVGASIRFAFESDSNVSEGGMMGNLLGRVVFSFNAPAQMTNAGFFTQNPGNLWPPGSVLGKSDNYVWPLPPQGAGVASYAFDHGVSDLVFGDAMSNGVQYRPEFNEIMYGATNGGAMWFSTPQDGLTKTLREEVKEARLKFGNFDPQGFFVNMRGHNQMMYVPRLKLVNGGQTNPLGHTPFWTALLQRPSIMDIDNLFSVKPDVPTMFRPSQAITSDPTYVVGQVAGGGYGGGYGARGGYGGGARGGYGGGGGRRRRWWSSLLSANETNSTEESSEDPDQEASTEQSNEDPDPDSMIQHEEITDASLTSLREKVGKLDQAQDGTNADERGALPVTMTVEWLLPVMQKYRCIDVAQKYAMAGQNAGLYIAMGWDTEGDYSNLDLDLSLIPFDAKKFPINHKIVYYRQKTPPALACGGAYMGYYGSRRVPGGRIMEKPFGMQAFVDDRSGDEPGDDELVKIDLGCIEMFHPDIDSIAVLVNIYSPAALHWNGIDSAYLRIISGGPQTTSMQSPRTDGTTGQNFFIHNAEAVRAYVRLSGNDLKADPDMARNGLMVGLFFKESPGNWAFAATMRGVQGKEAMESKQHLSYILQDLVYPANPNWDNTQEHKQMSAQGQFGAPGMMGKQTPVQAIQNGELPCIGSRKDQALMYLGGMNDQALQQAAANQKASQEVRQLAQQVQSNSQIRQTAQKLNSASVAMAASTSGMKRKQLAKEKLEASSPAPPPTAEGSAASLDDFNKLFDPI